MVIACQDNGYLPGISEVFAIASASNAEELEFPKPHRRTPIRDP
jgi:hypothetical protein